MTAALKITRGAGCRVTWYIRVKWDGAEGGPSSVFVWTGGNHIRWWTEYRMLDEGGELAEHYWRAHRYPIEHGEPSLGKAVDAIAEYLGAEVTSGPWVDRLRDEHIAVNIMMRRETCTR